MMDYERVRMKTWFLTLLQSMFRVSQAAECTKLSHNLKVIIHLKDNLLQKVTLILLF